MENLDELIAAGGLQSLDDGAFDMISGGEDTIRINGVEYTELPQEIKNQVRSYCVGAKGAGHGKDYVKRIFDHPIMHAYIDEIWDML